MIDINKKLLDSKCRELVAQYGDVLQVLQEEIMAEIDREEINGDTSFEYAKRFIRQRSMKEGMKSLIARINKYADGRK